MKRKRFGLVKKMMLAFAIPLLMGGFLADTAQAADTKPLIVAYEGLFTNPVLIDGECKAEEMDVIGGKPIDAEPTEGKVAKIFVDIVSGILKPVVDVLFTLDCPGVDNDKFSLVSEVLKIASPLNLTQNYIIMKLVSITQSLAFVIAFVLVVVYGFMYMTGFENLNPVKFGVRLFFAMIFVYYLPYLMQDILNINNVIVHYLSNIQVTFSETGNTASFVFAGAIADWIKSIAENFLVNLLTLILAIAMMYFAIAPIVKLITWWYVRMLKIFFYAIIGPIIVIMMALPQTSSMASKWVKDFIGEVFAQVFMVLGMAMLAFIMGNMGAFATMTNIGWLGTLLVMYGAIYFLAEVPDIASSFIGSIGGLSNGMLAGRVQTASKQATKAGKNAVASAASGAGNAVASRENGQRFSTMKSMHASKGMSGKAGALVGALAGKGVTARAPKLTKGEDGKLSMDKTRSLKDLSDTKVKPKVQNWNASRQEKKMEKSVGYADQSNHHMHAQQEKEREADARRTAKQLGLGEDAAKNIQGQSLNERTAASRSEVETGRDVIANLKKDGSIERASELNGIRKGTPPDNGGGGGGKGSPPSGYSEVFQGDKFNEKPMNDRDFQTLNEKLTKKDQKTMTPNEARKRGQERVKGHQEHHAAYFGGAGGGAVAREKSTSDNDKSNAIESLKKSSDATIQKPGGGSVEVTKETGFASSPVQQDKRVERPPNELEARRAQKDNPPTGKDKGDSASSPAGSPVHANGGTNTNKVVTPSSNVENTSSGPKGRDKTEPSVDTSSHQAENGGERKVDNRSEKAYETNGSSNVDSSAPKRTTGGDNPTFESKSPAPSQGGQSTDKTGGNDTKDRSTDRQAPESSPVNETPKVSEKEAAPVENYSDSETYERMSEDKQAPPVIGNQKKGKGIYYKDVVDRFQGKKDVDADQIAQEMKVSTETAKKLYEKLQKDNKINRD